MNVDLDHAIRDTVIANRILAHEGVVDAFGHVSVRNPVDRERNGLRPWSRLAPRGACQAAGGVSRRLSS